MNIQGSGSGSIGNPLDIGTGLPGTPSPALPPAAPTSANTGDSDGDNGTDTTQISSFAQLVDHVKELEKSDPDRARQVLGDVANRLHAEAHASGLDATNLGQLADKFQKAADSGDLSGLQPSGRHAPRGHGGGGRVQKAYGQDATEAQSLLGLLHTELTGAKAGAGPGGAKGNR